MIPTKPLIFFENIKKVRHEKTMKNHDTDFYAIHSGHFLTGFIFK